MVNGTRWTARLDDVRVLKTVAQGLQGAAGRAVNADDVVVAVRAVKTAATRLSNGLLPANRQSGDERILVHPELFRRLPSQIDDMMARAEQAGAGRTRSSTAMDAMMSIAGTGIYSIVKIVLDSTGRQDCMLM